MVTLSSCLFWQIISFILPPNEYGKWACDRHTEDVDFGKKKIIFFVTSKLSHFGHRKPAPHAYIEKPTHPKRITVWCGFWSRGTIGPFFFENFSLFFLYFWTHTTTIVIYRTTYSALHKVLFEHILYLHQITVTEKSDMRVLIFSALNEKRFNMIDAVHYTQPS